MQELTIQVVEYSFHLNIKAQKEYERLVKRRVLRMILLQENRGCWADAQVCDMNAQRKSFMYNGFQ